MAGLLAYKNHTICLAQTHTNDTAFLSDLPSYLPYFMRIYLVTWLRQRFTTICFMINTTKHFNHTNKGVEVMVSKNEKKSCYSHCSAAAANDAEFVSSESFLRPPLFSIVVLGAPSRA